jgi:cyclic pyranopterin phosphate synthase
MSKVQKAGMVDVGQKKTTARKAVACAVIELGKKAYTALVKDECPKGNVIETARVAAVMAAKSTPSIIPLCHPLELSKVKVDFEHDKKRYAVKVIVEVGYQGKTGVEMEVLTAASAGVLTIYDMMKWADKGMVIRDVKLISKTGGKSGDYRRK